MLIFAPLSNSHSVTLALSLVSCQLQKSGNEVSLTILSGWVPANLWKSLRSESGKSTTCSAGRSEVMSWKGLRICRNINFVRNEKIQKYFIYLFSKSLHYVSFLAYNAAHFLERLTSKHFSQVPIKSSHGAFRLSERSCDIVFAVKVFSSSQ